MQGELKIPGNLLLLGEYAVTLEGGLGIACTVDRFVTIRVCPAKRLQIDSSHGEELILFTLSRLFTTVPPLKIFVDSSALFGENGKKLGLGSSAAIVAGLTFLSNHSSSKAIEIHRAFQGGRGSGYDVVTSFSGIHTAVTLLFRGGKIPSYVHQAPPKESFDLIFGKRSVSTKEMLLKFEAYVAKEEFLHESNRIVLDYLADCNLGRAFRAGNILNRKLHEALQVGMHFEELDEQLAAGRVGKPLGAGFELGAVIH